MNPNPVFSTVCFWYIAVRLCSGKKNKKPETLKHAEKYTSFMGFLFFAHSYRLKSKTN